MTEYLGFKNIPIGLLLLGNRNIVLCVKDPIDALDHKQPQCQRTGMCVSGRSEVHCPGGHHRFASRDEFQEIRVRSGFGLDE